MSITPPTSARAELEARAARLPVQPGGDRAAHVSWPAIPARLTRLIEGNSEHRKCFPITTGVLDYFPDALAAVAEVSFHGNQKHNPGEPLHWARGKSMDHADCILRHLTERGGMDGTIRHSAALAWRALALLQEELEIERKLGKPRGATDLPPR